jgi:predicted ABC-type ATPase
MRVFAGPNGSGKSTIINFVSEYQINNRVINLGIYVNADDIAAELIKKRFSFSAYKIQTTKKEFAEIALSSGLIGSVFTKEQFTASYSFHSNKILLKKTNANEALAQIIADFLRKKLLQQKEKFSFETVFSHSSKLDIMQKAQDAGYKVYLYFVCTENPELNIERVKFRVNKDGHDVPKERIVARYKRSLNFLYDAAQLADRVYFFDNTGKKPVLFGSFKVEKGQKKWSEMKSKDIPVWFYNYYSLKIKNHNTNSVKN